MKKAREVLQARIDFKFGDYGVSSADELINALDAAGFVILPREPDEGLEALFHDKIRIMCDPQNKSASVLNFPELYRAMVQHYESKGEAE